MRMDDVSIYKKLHDLYVLSNTAENLIKAKSDDNKKLAQSKFEFIRDNIPVPDDARILDIGTMDCGFIANLNTLGQAQGINIESFDQYNYHTDTSCVKIYDGINVPYDDNTFDLVTVLMVLHHVPKDSIDTLLKSIYDVLKPGGLLLIRDHDVTKRIERQYIGWIHFFYELICEQESNWEFYDTYVANFMSKEELGGMLEELGFVNMDSVFTGSVRKRYIEPSFISRNYYTLFRKGDEMSGSGVKSEGYYDMYVTNKRDYLRLMNV